MNYMWRIVCDFLDFEALIKITQLNRCWKREIATLSIKQTLTINSPNDLKMLCKLIPQAESVCLDPDFLFDYKIIIPFCNLNKIRHLDLWAKQSCAFEVSLINTSGDSIYKSVSIVENTDFILETCITE